MATFGAWGLFMFIDTALFVSGMSFIISTSENWSLLNAQMIGQFFYLIFSFIVIIVVTIYSIKFASKLKNMGTFNHNLRVIESKALGLNNNIHLIKAGDRYFVVGTSKASLQVISELDAESVKDNLTKPEKPEEAQYNSVFEKIIAAGAAGMDKFRNTKNKEKDN
jgi:flagellar biogenesis protein FliO